MGGNIVTDIFSLITAAPKRRNPSIKKAYAIHSVFILPVDVILHIREKQEIMQIVAPVNRMFEYLFIFYINFKK